MLRYSYLFLFLLCCHLLASCSSREQLKEEIKKEILNEARNYHVPKGDGSKFYAEPFFIGNTEYYIHHSTLKCTSINSGVQRNWYKFEESNNIFCNTCMDDNLITTFRDRYFPQKNEKKKRMIEL